MSGVSCSCCLGWASHTKAFCFVLLVTTLCSHPSASELEEVVILGARNELSQALSGSTNVPLVTRDDQVSLDRTFADWLASRGQCHRVFAAVSAPIGEWCDGAGIGALWIGGDGRCGHGKTEMV